ncbi:Serine carboxypeptidase 3 [Lecanora helva]
MASRSVCLACSQSLRQSTHRVYSVTPPNQLRTCSKPPNPHKQFSTNHRLAAAQAKQQPKITITPSPLPNAPSKSSSAAPLQDTPPSQSATSTKKGLGQKIRDTLPSSVTETYIAYGACEKLIKECARQADYTIPQAREKDVEIPRTKDGEDLGVGTGWWFETLNLTPTFMTWAQITFLHMYLLTVRLRMFPPAHAPTWHQHLLDHFFYTAEERMVTTHNMAARSIRNKYLKDLFVQWRGLLAAYDEGLVRGDAVLATAVWRNVFKAGGLKKGDAGGAGGNVVDWRGLGDVVSYMRGVLKGLEGIGDEKIATGEVEFGDPGTERKGVLVRSRLMDAPGQLAGGTEKAGGRVKTVSDPSDIV